MSEAYKEALRELWLAQNNFNNAAPEYIESACYELSAAEARLRAVITERKTRRTA